MTHDFGEGSAANSNVRRDNPFITKKQFSEQINSVPL